MKTARAARARSRASSLWIGVALVVGLTACGRGSAPAGGPATGTTAAVVAPSPADQALLDQLPAAYRHADLDNGRLHFNLCKPCHTIVAGGPNMTGPNLHGLFGRKVASKADYSYSAALSAKSWTWDADQLDHWLKSPRTYVPGTKMSFYGIPDDEDRRDLIAYLKVASSGGTL